MWSWNYFYPGIRVPFEEQGGGKGGSAVVQNSGMHAHAARVP
jgi:hypothetical protein